MRFHFNPLSENSQRISVDGRPERIEMYAFSNENALVWTRHFLNQTGVNLINLLQMQFASVAIVLESEFNSHTCKIFYQIGHSGKYHNIL